MGLNKNTAPILYYKNKEKLDIYKEIISRPKELEIMLMNECATIGELKLMLLFTSFSFNGIVHLNEQFVQNYCGISHQAYITNRKSLATKGWITFSPNGSIIVEYNILLPLMQKYIPEYTLNNNSIGENNIIKILKANNINYETQKTFEDLSSTKGVLLRYDFYLPDYNRLIEFDGEQHYYPIEAFGGEKQFNYQKQLDKIKENYALSHNIILKRIPYWDKDNITLEMLLN